MSEKVTAMIEEIKGLTVLELSELVHALEEEFGVSAAAMAAPAAGAAALRIAGHGSLHGAQGRGAAARHGGRRGGGTGGRRGNVRSPWPTYPHLMISPHSDRAASTRLSTMTLPAPSQTAPPTGRTSPAPPSSP